MGHMYEKDLLYSRNQGYRKWHGIIMPILEAQEEALEAMDDDDIKALDQSAAFDVVEHSILREDEVIQQ